MKINKYDQYNLANIMNLNIKDGIKMKIKYRPLIIEASGGIIKESKIILKQIVKYQALKNSQEQVNLYVELLRNLIAQLQKDNKYYPG